MIFRKYRQPSELETEQCKTNCIKLALCTLLPLNLIKQRTLQMERYKSAGSQFWSSKFPGDVTLVDPYGQGGRISRPGMLTDVRSPGMCGKSWSIPWCCHDDPFPRLPKSSDDSRLCTWNPSSRHFTLDPFQCTLPSESRACHRIIFACIRSSLRNEIESLAKL